MVEWLAIHEVQQDPHLDRRHDHPENDGPSQVASSLPVVVAGRAGNFGSGVVFHLVMRVPRILALFLMLLAGSCVADRALAPGLYVLDDVGAGRWKMVSVGFDHSCALDLDGRAWCWGSNKSYQLGVVRTDSTCGQSKYACSLTPIPVATGRQFRTISAGASHTCAISTDSVPFCWGNNLQGQVGVAGIGLVNPRIVGSVPMIAISAGAEHSCGIRIDSLAVCWGSNHYGALGNGTLTGLAPTIVSTSLKFAEIGASDQRTCARLVSRKVMCWGAIWARTSGDTNYSLIRPSPALVSGASAMAGISVGPNSTCGFDLTGFVWCWESNVNGEGGQGAGPGSLVPRRIRSDAEFTRITLGGSHACGITSDGETYCWGNNSWGQLGSRTSDHCGINAHLCSTVPTLVYGRQRFVSISAGMGGHTCGVTDRQNLYCWGAGNSGQRGDGTRASHSFVPLLAAVGSPQ
jgi:alpha-tubulin suppressor-like RCC1 family protein